MSLSARWVEASVSNDSTLTGNMGMNLQFRAAPRMLAIRSSKHFQQTFAGTFLVFGVASAALHPKVQATDTLSMSGHAHPDSKGRLSPPPTRMLLVISVLRRLLALLMKGQGACIVRGRLP